MLAATGCSSELHHGLEEPAANEMVVTLSTFGIDAEKAPDPADPDKWTVTVPHGVRVEAWSALQQAGLPRPEISGFSSFYPREGLVPSAEEERIIVQFATAQELRRAILAMHGVVDAHVNLVLPELPRVRLAQQELPRPRASVLVRHRAFDPPTPFPSDAVRRLVAGSVDRMTPEDVEVVSEAVPAPSKATTPAISSVGPVAVTADTKPTLQALVGVLVVMVLGLSTALAVLLVRRK